MQTQVAVAVLAVLVAAALTCGASAGQPAARPAEDVRAAADAAVGKTDRPLRILALMTIDTMSHHIWMSALTVELARRGHHVESVDVAVPKEVPPTLNVSVIETAFHKGLANLMHGWIDMNPLQQMAMIYKFGVHECEFDLTAPTMMRYVDKKYPGTFDLVILDYIGDCFLGFSHRFGGIPIIALSPFPGSSWMDSLMGNPNLPGTVPLALMPFPQPMNLWQRALTTAITLYAKALEVYFQPGHTAVLRKYFGEDVPTAEELHKAVHLGFVNEDPVLDGSRPYSPSVIPVGGMHVRPANLSRIPAELRAWLEAAEDGFIFVSFGSIVRGELIAAATKQALVDGFGALGDRVRVLWKIEDGILDAAKIPSNVRTSPWLPQNDLLGHPKMLLFVSHCGGLSSQEASYHGVPMLGVPFVVDQFINLEKVVRNGMARPMPHKEITRERLVAEVRELLGNPRYREAARRTSRLLRDQKETPLQRAVWWTEYVGRNGGAPHLRSPVRDVPLLSAWLLDVAALALLTVLAVLAVAFLVLRTCARLLCAGARRIQGKAAKKHAKRD